MIDKFNHLNRRQCHLLFLRSRKLSRLLKKTTVPDDLKDQIRHLELEIQDANCCERRSGIAVEPSSDRLSFRE